MTAQTHGLYADEDSRWAAVAARDKAADGRFWCAVVTTKIYCRPSCPARAHRKNVRFVASPEEARAQGFRACKRCRPDDAAAPQRDASRGPM